MRIRLLVSVAYVFVFVLGCSTSKGVPQDGVFISVTAKEFKGIIEQQDPDAVLLDIRTPGEYSEGRIKGARNIDFYASSFETELNALDKTKTYLIYCRSGNRTGQALFLMKKLGFLKVINLENGIVDWEGNAFTLEK